MSCCGWTGSRTGRYVLRALCSLANRRKLLQLSANASCLMTSEAIDLVQAEQGDFLGIHGPRDFGMGKDPIHSTGLCSFVCGKRSNKQSTVMVGSVGSAVSIRERWTLQTKPMAKFGRRVGAERPYWHICKAERLELSSKLHGAEACLPRLREGICFQTHTGHRRLKACTVLQYARINATGKSR